MNLKYENEYPISSSKDLDPLMERIGDARIVMLGEASHGTHEFYTWRSQITKRLLQEKGFNFIAVEGDWPDCYKINRYIKGFEKQVASELDILKQFNRWPTWMWANWEIASLVKWLKEFNGDKPANRKAGFYGLDVYSLWESMETLVEYLDKNDPSAAAKAREAMKCFEPFGEEGHLYARAPLSSSCQQKVSRLLDEVKSKSAFYDHDLEASLNSEQNAVIAVNAEKYYRSMVMFTEESWNIRDRHMEETLTRIMQHHGSGAKSIVWAHNTHIGDARYTNMDDKGMVNIGQLVRQQYGDQQVVLVGFGSYRGSVVAAGKWGAPAEVMQVPAAKSRSVEASLHEQRAANHMLIFDRNNGKNPFRKTMAHRAIGVVYHPERDHSVNYVPSLLSDRYDAFIYLDHTTALHPLDVRVDAPKTPETYPFEF
ncbi:MAG TPA: erythromycin esterase family protein [Chitinophagaceae bacterium]|jgi:erythromycin esterase-like protein|nr:erythromycin esterase family protein [Chitinophagaceae bacterium]